MFSLLKLFKKKPVPEKPVITEIDRQIIKAFAGGNEMLKFMAIEVHRRHFKAKKLPIGDPYFEFMREIDTVCPDLYRQNIYRNAVINS